MAAMLPDLLKASLRGVVRSSFPPDHPLGTPQQPIVEGEAEPSARFLRIQKFIIDRLSVGYFLSGKSGLKPLPEKLPLDKSENNLLDYARYSHPRFITTSEAISVYRGKTNENLRAMGIRVDFADLLSMLSERYDQILAGGLVPSLIDSIDPSVTDFDQLTRKFSDLTGIPQNVIQTIWWRENFGIGNAPHLHEGKHSPSGDGPLAPFVHLYNMPIQPQGVYQYSADTQQFARSFRIPPEEVVKTIAFMGDNRLVGRNDENIIITPIRTDLVQYDAELNIITGLILYYQAMEAVFSDPLISQAVEHALNQDSELDYWSIGYSVYHHGPVPVQAKLLNQTSAGFEYNSPDWQAYFITPAVAAKDTKHYQSWTQSRYIRKSGFADDPNDLEFFDILDFYDRWNELVKANPEFEIVFSGFMKMYSETERRLPNQVASIGCLLLFSNTEVVDFLEREMSLVVTTPTDQEDVKKFIAFCRKIGTVLSENNVNFGTFTEVGDANDPKNESKIPEFSPIYDRLVSTFGYYLDEQMFFSHMSDLFHTIIRSVTPQETGSRSGSQPDIGTDVIYTIAARDVERFKKLIESLEFALTAEVPPKNQADYYKEFIIHHPKFHSELKRYQQMRASYEHRFGESTIQAMIIPIVAADEAATKFALESILRLYGSPELVGEVGKLLLAFREANTMNNSYYYQLKPEDSDSELFSRMKENPLHQLLEDIARSSEITSSQWDSMSILSHILFGQVYPKAYDKFMVVSDTDWVKPEIIVDQLKRHDPTVIAQRLSDLIAIRNQPIDAARDARLPR